VAAAIGAAPPPTPTTSTAAKPNPSSVVDVINSGSMSGMAGEVARALKKHGYTAGQVRDRNSGEPTTTTIEYGTGAQTDADNVATLLGLDAPKRPDPGIQPEHIRVTVDTNFAMPATDDTTSMDETLTSTTTSSTASTYYYNGTATTYPTPDEGKPIDGGGVPCVN